MRISIKIPRGYEEKFNRLTPEKKEQIKIRLSSIIAEELGSEK
jgi:hypothetical protein